MDFLRNKSWACSFGRIWNLQMVRETLSTTCGTTNHPEAAMTNYKLCFTENEYLHHSSRAFIIKFGSCVNEERRHSTQIATQNFLFFFHGSRQLTASPSYHPSVWSLGCLTDRPTAQPTVRLPSVDDQGLRNLQKANDLYRHFRFSDSRIDRS